MVLYQIITIHHSYLFVYWCMEIRLAFMGSICLEYWEQPHPSSLDQYCSKYDSNFRNYPIQIDRITPLTHENEHQNHDLPSADTIA